MVKDLIEKLLPTLTPVIGGIWVFYKYFDHQAEQRKQEATQFKKEMVARRLEASRPFLEKQLSLYFEAATIAGKLASILPSDQRWKETEERFWQLYWCELSMVESGEVEEKMKHLGDELINFKNAPESKKIRRRVQNKTYVLAHAIRDSLSDSWLKS